MSYNYSKTVQTTFDDAVRRVREELKAAIDKMEVRTYLTSENYSRLMIPTGIMGILTIATLVFPIG